MELTADSLTVNSYTELQADSLNSSTDKIADGQTVSVEDQQMDDASTETLNTSVPDTTESDQLSKTELSESVTLPTADKSGEVEAKNKSISPSSLADFKRDCESSELSPDSPQSRHKTISPLVSSSQAGIVSSTHSSQSRTESESPDYKDHSGPSSVKSLVRSGQPSPFVLPSLTASLHNSSTELPPSPFLIPKNPFLCLVGKIPQFQWDSVHFSLLENLIRSLHAIVRKWTRYL